jgi:hypothetical protein
MLEKINENKNVLAVGVLCLALGYLYATTMDKSVMDMSMNHDNMQMENHAHKHVQVEQGKKDPTLSINVLPDTMGGFNLNILTTNYTFTPEKAGQVPVQNEGHAHVFVNGKKIGRAYGPWYYIGKENFHSGNNTVTVYLNANDHSDWVKQDGETEISASQTVEVK